MNEAIELNWMGPFSFRQVVEFGLKGGKPLDLPGVYIWIENVLDLECITYIGKSQSTLFARLLSHYRNFAGGQYSIPCYARSEPYRSSNGKHWMFFPDKPECVKRITDYELLKELIKESLCYAASITLYAAGVAKEDTKAVERNLLFKYKPLWTRQGTRSQPPRQLSLTHGGELSGSTLERWRVNTARLDESFEGNRMT